MMRIAEGWLSSPKLRPPIPTGGSKSWLEMAAPAKIALQAAHPLARGTLENPRFSTNASDDMSF